MTQATTGFWDGATPFSKSTDDIWTNFARFGAQTKLTSKLVGCTGQSDCRFVKSCDKEMLLHIYLPVRGKHELVQASHQQKESVHLLGLQKSD